MQPAIMGARATAGCPPQNGPCAQAVNHYIAPQQFARRVPADVMSRGHFCCVWSAASGTGPSETKNP